MKIRLFNVKYSPNLGDGLLSECLEQALHEHGADHLGTYSVDLGGRTQYARGSVNRGRLLSVLHATPPTLRLAAMRVLLNGLAKSRWEPHYIAGLKQADAIVIGGGNLFTDMDLNFPIKINSALTLAAKARLPSAVYGVGVAKEWSKPGLEIMRKALKKASPCYVSVRDEASKENFDHHFADAAGREAIVVRDPGLMISRYLNINTTEPRSGRIGICITSAIALNYHSDFRTSDQTLELWYEMLCRRLTECGSKLLAFTNGSPEDDQFLERLASKLIAVTDGNLEIIRASSPNQLATTISGLSFLIAHRMHALIAAFSCGVPIYALQWDRKVNAFVDSVGLSDRIAPAVADTYDLVATRAMELRGAVTENGDIVKQAFEDVSSLLDSLSRSATALKV